MSRTVTALLSTALLLLVPWILSSAASSPQPTITLTVYNSLKNTPNKTFTGPLVFRGVLLGVMKTVMAANKDFRFKTTENIDYGPFLTSINGVAGSTEKHTYWELLVQKEDGTVFAPDVGVGCYIPTMGDNIIFKFTKY